MEKIKNELIEKAYKRYPDLIRFSKETEFTEDEKHLVFWYNVKLPNGSCTTKVEVHKW